MKTFHFNPSFFCVVLWMLLAMAESSQPENVLLRNFHSVSNVDIEENTCKDSFIDVMSKVRCATLCVERGCLCVSFTFDRNSNVCYMFSEILLSGHGSSKGFNKITGCAFPQVIPNAVLRNYTGCNATYDCNFGYTANMATSGHNTVTCHPDETWAPSDFSCIEKPCSSLSNIINGSVNVTGLVNVGGSAKYTCNDGFINRGGTSDTLTCQLGGTWSGTINVVCKPINIQYRISIRTASVSYAGTAADVYINLFGSYGNITIEMPTEMEYFIGKENTYQVVDEDVGTLKWIGIGHDNSGGNPAWKLGSVDITIGGLDVYEFFADAWIQTPDLYKIFYPSKS